MRRSIRSSLSDLRQIDEAWEMDLEPLTTEIAAEIISLSPALDRRSSISLISVGQACIWHTLQILSLITIF
jgi:hypothetical protein